MKKTMILASAGAGGDLQPLMAAALGLRERSHTLVFLGDQSVAATVQPLGIESHITPPEHDLGPRLIAAVQDSLILPEQDRGAFVERRLSDWASGLAPVVQDAIRALAPDLLVTSLFGTGIARRAIPSPSLPWAVVNSTFYVGPNPPRPLELDVAPRALPLFKTFVQDLAHAPLVLHSTDAEFDYDHTGLPPTHHYVGPLMWEPTSPPPVFLQEPGDPWVLATISSQLQDDLPLAQLACAAFAGKPLRVVLTVGAGHMASQVGEIPRNVRVENYIGHSAVLDRARLFVGHAGHGSVMKALWHGVPMVLVPWGRDQPGVAARAQHLGVTRVISRTDLTQGRLAEAITDVLQHESYSRAAAEFKRHLDQRDPVATACDYLEQIA